MNKLIELVLDIAREMHTLNEYIRWEGEKISQRMADEWLDSDGVVNVLKISKRNLQNLRDDGVLPFSRIKGKFYYRAEDLEELLKSNYLKKGEE